MASDENDPRRNPFIAFRRFADSQVNSLLNTVFTLPSTIANYNNAHVAREKCLFGRGDTQKCHELHEIEKDIAKVVAECRHLYHAGSLEEAFEKGEALMRLNVDADTLRKQIVEADRTSEAQRLEAGKNGTVADMQRQRESSRSSKELVEKVANEKGQQWGWSWDWDFPRPFDAEERSSNRSDRCHRWRPTREDRMQLGALDEAMERRNTSFEGFRSPEEWSRYQDQQSRERLERLAEMTAEDWVAKLDDIVSSILEADRRANTEREEHIGTWPSSQYTEEMARAGVPRDAFEDLIRSKNGLPLMPSEEIGQSSNLPYDSWMRRFWDQTDRHFVGRSDRREYPKRVPWEGEETAEEPNYEYSHDHEDQHDEPPSPKSKQGNWSADMPETELEAYERLLGPSSAPGISQAGERPSILSTLTTTERTVSPDGTVTTKVVLKKRFADGREESSETLYTQKGEEDGAQTHDRWPAMPTHQRPQEQPQKPSEKKSGWFWSS